MNRLRHSSLAGLDRADDKQASEKTSGGGENGENGLTSDISR